MDWCDVCKYNPPDYSSHEPDKPCGDCWVFGEGNEPSKFVETENRQTNADRIRSMSDEELDKFLGEVQWDVANYCGGVTQKQEYPVPEQRGAWFDWLKEEATND